MTIGTREYYIKLLEASDRNGSYSDEEHIGEGSTPLTLEELKMLYSHYLMDCENWEDASNFLEGDLIEDRSYRNGHRAKGIVGFVHNDQFEIKWENGMSGSFYSSKHAFDNGIRRYPTLP